MSEEIKNNEGNNEKPFPFWRFMILMFIGLVFLTSLVVGIPYLLSK